MEWREGADGSELYDRPFLSLFGCFGVGTLG